MPSQLSEGFVLGALSDALRQSADIEAVLAAGRPQAAAIEAELQEAAERHLAARAMRHGARRAQDEAARTLGDTNGQLAKLHQEVAELGGRAAALDAALAQATEPEARRHLRRNRAVLSVEIEDRQALLAELTARVGGARQQVQRAQADEVAGSDAERRTGVALDQLQARLPRPRLYFDLFAARATAAHCSFVLQPDVGRWRAAMGAAAQPVQLLHAALRAGRYRVDAHSEVMGGRALQTAEAIYAVAAGGDEAAAAALFAAACDVNLFFHHIFAVFRCWCIGLYLSEARAELGELAALHGYAQGVRGAYAQAFMALLDGDELALGRALRGLTEGEWSLWQRQPQRGLGLVNVAAITVCRLARRRGLRVPRLGATVPQALVLA